MSIVASIYDPLGLKAPVLLNGKVILQEVCKHGSGWDDPLSDTLSLRWEQWKEDLNELQRVNIQQTYISPSFGKATEANLHHFSDASTHGYGQCSYLRLRNKDGNVHCSLVMAKSRVSPLKLATVPCLELTAAVVFVQLYLVIFLRE